MTSLNTTLESLFKQGVKAVTFAVTDKMEAIVTVDQEFSTQTGRSKCRHEAVAHDHETAVAAIQKSVDQCAPLQSKLLKLN